MTGLKNNFLRILELVTKKSWENITNLNSKNWYIHQKKAKPIWPVTLKGNIFYDGLKDNLYCIIWIGTIVY